MSSFLRLPAQSVRVGVSGQIPMGELGEMGSMLALADEKQKSVLLARLGIDPAVTKIVLEELLPGQEIELHPVRTQGKIRTGVAFLPAFRACYLYLLTGTEADPKRIQWRASEQQILNCWDGAASLELLPLRSPGQDDLVLHHLNCDHGTGILVDETQVFTIVNHMLRKVLETQDLREETTIDTGKMLAQRSTFQQFPNQLYEETRTSSEGDVVKKVERRFWRWSEGRGKFVPTGFVSVAALDSRP